MAKQDQLPLFAVTQSPVTAIAAYPLNVIGILREAIKIPARNGKFMLQILLIILSPFSLIVLLHYLLAGPLMAKVEDSYEQSSLDQKDVRSLMGLEVVFFTAFCVVCLFGMMLTIFASASAYIDKHMGLNDLMLKIQLAWKNPFITWLYISLLTIIYFVVLIVMLKLVNLLGTANSWVVGILGVFFYLYLAARWTLALVISVLEDDSHGAKALGRVQELITGRKLQGFFLMFILVLLSIPIYILFYVTATDDDDELGPFTQFSFGFLATVLLCLAKFFIFVVFTVFYYECKQSHGEKVEMESGFGY